MRLACWIALLVAFVPTIVWSFDGWMLEHGYYGHGPLLVAAGLWFTYRARTSFRAAPAGSSRLGFAALILCLLLHVAGQALLVDGLSGIVFVPAMFCLVWTLDGFARLRTVAPALCCFAFAVPLPIFVTGKLAYVLKNFATVASVALGRVCGVALEQDGARIFVPEQELPLLVGDACSGLRSLVALVALGWVFAFWFTDRTSRSKFLLALAAIPVALFANVLRITALAILAFFFGTDFATGTAHDVSGWLIYVAALGMLYGLDRLTPGRDRGRKPASTESDDGAAGRVAVQPARAPVLVCIVLGLAGAAALALAWTTPGESKERFASKVLTKTERFASVREHEFPEQWYDLLGTRDVCWRRYSSWDGGSLDVTAIFQGSSWKSLHPPEVCLQSAGYEIVKTETRSAEANGERFGLTLLEALHARGQRRYLIAYTFVGPSFKTPSFLGFFWRNIPSALFRRDARAVLLRLDVPWPEGTPRGDIEARISAFYADILPSLEELVKT